MVSIKSILAIVLLAAVCADATYSKPTYIRRCSQGYYSKWNLSYSGEWKKCTTLIQSVFGLVDGLLELVGGLLNTILGIVGNLLGGLLGINKTNSILDKVFTTPNNKGSLIQLIIKVGILNAPCYDKINPGLSKIYIKVFLCNMLLGISVRGGYWPGLQISLLTGNKNTWISKCGCANIKQEWDAHLLSIGGLNSLSPVKRCHYDIIGSLVGNLVKGVLVLVNGLLEKVMYDVFCLWGLLANLLDGSLDYVLNEVFDLCEDLFETIDISIIKINIKTKISKYNSSYFCNCYRC